MKSNFGLRAALIAGALLLAGVAVYFWADRPAAEQAGPHAVSVEGKIVGVTARRMGEQMQLKVELRLAQSGQSALQLVPPFVVLRAASGAEVPRYLGPMLPEPVLRATEGKEEEVTLHYWLTEGDAAGKLTLIAGETPMPLPQLPGLADLPEGEVAVEGK